MRLPLRGLVYVACCLDTATQDVARLLSGGGLTLSCATMVRVRVRLRAFAVAWP
jgi:hypothetical protein